MTIMIRGIGWLTQTGYGCIRSGLHRPFPPGEGTGTLTKKDFFSYSFKNFGRLDGISRMTAYAVALTLQDAGIEYSPDKKQDIGIIGTNEKGSLQSDLAYFKDYVRSGRTLSRGNLFIYTLPSSPIGEAAIHFGFMGPVLYAAGLKNSLGIVLDMAADLVRDWETSAVLAGSAEEGEAIYFLVDDWPAEASLCTYDEARLIVESVPDVSGLTQQFSGFTSNTRKGAV
jgi:hypothetical protein